MQIHQPCEEALKTGAVAHERSDPATNSLRLQGAPEFLPFPVLPTNMATCLDLLVSFCITEYTPFIG